VIRAVAAALLLALAGCPPEGDPGARRPAGTPTDPVDACERMGQVCRIDRARLGVCTDGPPGSCPDGASCLRCVSQH
jgi:hypothetical protein